MKAFLAECRVLFSCPQNIILLLTRLVLAFGFVQPALMKINDLEGTTKWFESMDVMNSFMVFDPCLLLWVKNMSVN